MLFAYRSIEGPGVFANLAERREQLTAAQLLSRRNAEWLDITENGAIDRTTGEKWWPSCAQIGSMYGVSREAVRLGVIAARDEREATRQKLAEIQGETEFAASHC
jgi:hypothetical protein